MAEVTPAALVIKRNEADIARLESNIINQELEVMELEQRIIDLNENIEASRAEVRRKQDNIKSVKEQRGEEVSNG